MKKKKQKSEFAWPFLKRRVSRICIADRSFETAQLTVSAFLEGASVDTPLAIRKFRKAARFYERAAEYYRSVGLSLAAKESFTFASECWSSAGERDETARCLRLAADCPEYWS